jgi:hypothetical protein
LSTAGWVADGLGRGTGIGTEETIDDRAGGAIAGGYGGLARSEYVDAGAGDALFEFRLDWDGKDAGDQR